MDFASAGEALRTEEHDVAGLPRERCRAHFVIRESTDAAMVRMNPSAPGGNNKVLDRAARI